jgi:hypothetical protein
MFKLKVCLGQGKNRFVLASMTRREQVPNTACVRLGVSELTQNSSSNAQ